MWCAANAIAACPHSHPKKSSLLEKGRLNSRHGTLKTLTAPFSVIDRYVMREAFVTLLAVALVLLLIIVGNTLARNLAEAAKGDLPVQDVFRMLALQSVNYAVLLLPLAGYLGLMLGLGRLHRDSEMVALAACGVGTARLYRSVLLFSIPLTLAMFLLSLYAAPWAARQAYDIVDQAERNAELIGLRAGQFNEIKQGDYVIYVERLSKDHHTLFNVFIRSEQNNRPTVMGASRAHLEIDDEHGYRYLVLENGRRYEGRPGAADYRILDFDSYAVRIQEQVGRKAKVKPDARTTKGLLDSSHPYDFAELQWRIAIPVSLLVLSLLAVPLSHTAPREGRYARLFIGILVYLLYVNLLSVARVWLEKDVLPSWLGLWWVHVLPLLYAFYLLAGQLGWSWLRSRLPGHRHGSDRS